MGLFDKIVDDWLGDPFGTYHQEAQAQGAAQTQARYADEAIEEQRRQYDIAQEALRPFAEAGASGLSGLFQTGERGREYDPMLREYAQLGSDALAEQRALAGLGGFQAQKEALNAIRGGAEYQAMVDAGEEAILQNAAATGGLRGGNTQRALMEYRPQVMADLINQRYSRLGGLAGMGGNVAQQQALAGQQASGNLAQLGQAAAAGQASGALQTGGNIANLLQQQGAAIAGGQMASGFGRRGSMSNLMSLGGMAAGGGFGGF